MVTVFVYRDKKYGAIATIENAKSMFKMVWAAPKKENKKMKIENDDDKPVYTKNWRKVDKEAMENTMLSSMIFLVMLNPKTKNGYERKSMFTTRIETLYWVLHDHTPGWLKRPCTYTNFVVHGTEWGKDGEYDADVSSVFWALNIQHSDPLYKRVAKKGFSKMSLEEFRVVRKEWLDKTEKKMIRVIKTQNK